MQVSSVAECSRHVTITRVREQSAFCRENLDDQHPLSGFCPYESAEASGPSAPRPPANQGPAWTNLSSLPQRPLFIPTKTKPKVYSSHPRHPKHPDIPTDIILGFCEPCFGLPASLSPSSPLSPPPCRGFGFSVMHRPHIRCSFALRLDGN